jgi:pimeloyl-ACP methyl ester carboxylesterase
MTSKEGADYVHADQTEHRVCPRDCVKPSWYMVAKNDRTVHPELQRFVAKRMGATVYEIDSSHVPMLSNPGPVIDVIRVATNTVQRITIRA